MDKITPFHIAVPVYDLEEARKFYREILGCSEGGADKSGSKKSSPLERIR